MSVAYYMVTAYLAEKAGANETRKPVGRRRARQPAGREDGGQFVGDDPTTPENEAWEMTG